MQPGAPLPFAPGRRPAAVCRLRLLSDLAAELPGELPPELACDAVEVSAEYGRQIMDVLPRAGAVFGTGRRWWWLVPPESHVGLDWPADAHYWVDGTIDLPEREVPPAGNAAGAAGAAWGTAAPAELPRLIHCPGDADEPYTHPLLLYVAVCRLAGVPPVGRLRAG